MSDMQFRFWPVVAVAAVLAACSTPSAQSARQPAPTDVVATVGSGSITLAQVDDKAMQQSTSSFGGMKLSQALYEARRAALDDLVSNMLIDQEAKARGVDRVALIEKEITSKVPSVSVRERVRVVSPRL